MEGPSSIIVSNKTGNIFFTDSGPFGDNISNSKKGSVFLIDMQLQSIRPLALRCLASPNGLAFGKNEKVIYIAETGLNRIVRLFQS